ncbi:hypothetical protein Tco_0845151 [Tanacetum coccineum]
MHMYVSHLKDAELKTLIATYDIPLDLRPRLPDSNFRMSILPAGDNTIDPPPSSLGLTELIVLLSSGGIGLSEGISLTSSGGAIFNSSGAVGRLGSIGGIELIRRLTSSGGGLFDWERLDLFGVHPEWFKWFHSEDVELKALIATYDIPLDLRPRLPDSNFRMINLPVGDTAIGIYSRIFDSSGGDWFSFAKRGGSTPVCMEVTKSGLKQLREKFFLIDHRAIPFHMPWRHPDSCITDKIPTDFNQDHVDRLKAHIVKLRDIPEGVLVRSGLSRVWRNPMCDPVLRRSDNTAMSIHDFLCMPSLEKATVREEPHELGTSILSRVADHTTPPAPAAPDAQPLDTGAGADEVASDGHVDSYFDARVSNTAGDVIERDLLPFAPGPYYLPYPYEENDGCESPPYTKDDWDEIHGVNLGLRKKELYKDPQVCRTAIDRFPTPAEIHRLHDLSSAELSDRMSVLQCQLITHGRAFHARYDHSLREVERLAKQCAQQTQIIKKQTAELKQHKESVARASEEVSGLKAELGALKSKCEATEHKLSSWDKKHRKYRSERDTLAKEKAKIEEELKSRLEHRERQAKEIQGNITSFFQSDFTPLARKFLKSSEFNRAFAGVLNTAISVGVERALVCILMQHSN